MTTAITTTSTRSAGWIAFLLLGALVMKPVASSIVGGTAAAKGDFPTFIISNVDDDTGVVCGATLIHSDIGLTAAHCAGAYSVGEEIYVGATNIYGSDADYTATITAISLHPEYYADGSVIIYDVMVFKLDQELSGAPVQTLADANGNEDPLDDAVVEAAGFGRISTDGPFPTSLLKVDVNVMDQATCGESFACIVDRIHLCVGSETGGEGICNGDSGGPLFYNGKQVGVTSFRPSSGCALANQPSVFVKVSGVRDWIDEQVCDLAANRPGTCTQRRQAMEIPEEEQQNLEMTPHRGLLEPSLFFFLCRREQSVCPSE